MTLLRIAFIALLMPLSLAACQTSHTAVSTYAGTSLRSDPVKTVKNKQTKKRQFKNEAASLVVKPNAAKVKAAKKTSKKRAKRSTSKKRTKKTLFRTTAKNKKSIRKFKRKTALLKRKTKKRKVKRAAKNRNKAGSRSRYSSMIARHARQNGVPLKLAMAVVQVESNYRASARGRAGEVGLMQIRPRTARGIGYKGSTKNLYNPETNIRYGMKYLGKAYKLGGGSTCGAILKYNAGHGAKRMNPISRKYCKKVRRIMGRS